MAFCPRMRGKIYSRLFAICWTILRGWVLVVMRSTMSRLLRGSSLAQRFAVAFTAAVDAMGFGSKQQGEDYIL